MPILLSVPASNLQMLKSILYKLRSASNYLASQHLFLPAEREEQPDPEQDNHEHIEGKPFLFLLTFMYCNWVGQVLADTPLLHFGV